MSLIYDNPWLISQLLKSALSDEDKLSKKAQIDPNTQYASAGLQAMLNNLRDEITPLKEGPSQIGYGVASDLKSQDMDSMGDFVQWLASHGTRLGGKIIVYPGNVEQPAEDYGFYKLEGGSVIEVPVAKSERPQVAYWINEAALKQFLVSLQSDEKLRTNVIFQVQLLKLIQMANQELDMGIGEEYKKPEETLPDDTKLDDIPNPINETSGTTVPLTFGDLKSLQAFWNWAINKGMSFRDKQGVIIQAGTQNFDRCAFINAIAARAKNNYAYRLKNSQQYWAQIQFIAKEAGCEISGGQPGQQGQQGGQPGQANPAAIQQLTGLRPFNSEFIDLHEIKVFVDAWAQISNLPEDATMAQQINTSIDSLKRMMRMQTDRIMIGQIIDSNDLQPVKDLSATPVPFLDVLNTIVYYAGTMYQKFVNVAKNVLPKINPQFDPTPLTAQIGTGGPWSVNVSEIGQLRRRLGKEIAAGQ